MPSICILGRQPAIGLAELESLYGADRIRPLGSEAALIDLSADKINLDRLGGTVKLCKLLTTLPTTKWPEIQAYLEKSIPEQLQYLPEGKLQIGFSAYGLNVTAKQLQASGLSIKKLIRSHGRSVRLIPNQEPALSSAQVLHNHLTGKLGWELVLIKDDQQTILAQTVAIQDINAYAARDQARPKRDARVGMLPPKLAQIIVNLAVSQVHEGSGFRVQGLDQKTILQRPYTLSPNPSTLTVLDPFCGTGVILQEAALMGYTVYGTDIEPRMVEYSKTNLEWILQKYAAASKSKIEFGDATNHAWKEFDAIAAETYLGRAFSALPAPAVLQQVVQDVDTIHKKFLQNVRRQTKPGFRLCLALPAWKLQKGFRHLPVLDSLEELGYTRVSFVHADNRDLIYHRPNQIVGRELVVLQRK